MPTVYNVIVVVQILVNKFMGSSHFDVTLHITAPLPGII